MKTKIQKFYTDDWEVYKTIIPTGKHVSGKKYTYKIEQNNPNIRHYLSRMTRKAKVVSKSKEMIHISLKIAYHLNEGNLYQFYQNNFLSIF